MGEGGGADMITSGCMSHDHSSCVIFSSPSLHLGYNRLIESFLMQWRNLVAGDGTVFISGNCGLLAVNSTIG